MLLFCIFFVWQQDPSASSVSVSNPEEKCGWLPSFLCNIPDKFSFKGTPNKPFDPKTVNGVDANGQAVPSGGADPTQLKMNFIKSTYQGERAKKLALGHEYYEKIMKVIHAGKPKCGKLANYPNGNCIAMRVETNSDNQIYSENYLSSFLKLDDHELKLMVDSHKYVLDNLPDSYPSGLYQGDGIVYVGGGKFNWLALLSVRSLRAQNCQLPVEVFVPSLEELELELCSRIFPVMNARCVHLPTVLFGEKSELAEKFKFLGYQYKSLAILLSSFENVLLLDSDNVPAYAPDHLFRKDPFASRGFIVWPDFWHRTTSPDYYKIAGVEVSKTKLLPRYNERDGDYIDQDVPGADFDWENSSFHEREGSIPDPSSESGQLMISKKTHMNSLLLALYYNLYGPDYYYPLFSQGAQGEGDKETFLAATIATHKPFYQVAKFLDALGNVRNDAFNGNAMGQYDPVQDYEWVMKKKELRKTLTGDAYKDAVSKLQSPKIIFVHANVPKLNPWTCFVEEDTVDKQGNRYRLYGLGMRVRTGTDFEQDQWNYMYQLLCDLELKVEIFKNVDRKLLCKEIATHRDWLIATQDTLE